MIIDANSLPTDTLVEADLCIVGAGVAGLTLAAEMLGSGVKVCLLESGGLEFEEEADELSEGESLGINYCTLRKMRGRRVGGTSHLWIHSLGPDDDRLGARMRPLDAIDFEKRDAVPYSGWPFSKAHLDPYYARAEKAFDIHPRPYAVEHWGSDSRVRPFMFKGDELRTAVLKIGPRDPFIHVYPRKIRDSSDVALYTHAHVLDIETDETAKSVTSLRVSSLHGKRFRAHATVFVLAAGGIETPRLLLVSDGTNRAGLGNSRGLVGKFYMEHPHFWLNRFLPSGHSNRTAAKFYTTHSEAGARLLGNIALSEHKIRREGLLNLGVALTPHRPHVPPPRSRRGLDSLRVVLANLKRGQVPHELATHIGNIGSEAHIIAYRAIAKSRGLAAWIDAPAFRLSHMTEQAPNPNSSLYLSSEKDRFGKRRICRNWRLQQCDMDSVARSHAIINENLVRSRVGRLEFSFEELPEPNINGGYHPMGATRMHIDPAQGVVDDRCRVHGVANLFIAGSSVFPTGGFANPTLTVGALAIRLADDLKTVLKKCR